MRQVIAVHFLAANPSEMNQNDDSKRWWENPKVVIAILTVVAGLGLVSVFLPLGLSWGDVLSSKKAQFYVTEVGVPLLTFAGFLAVYLGFLSQRQQNKLQERELDNQREQIEAQQANFQKDRFESTFFQLLRTQNQIVEDIQVERKRKTTEGEMMPEFKTVREGKKDVETILINGRRCLQLFYSELSHLFERATEKKGWEEAESGKEPKIRWVYAKWFSSRKSELNHYFNHLAKIISFVHRSDIQEKEFYIDLLIAQMSMPELKLFFYHVNLLKDESGHRHLREVHEVLGEYTFFEQIDRRSLAHDQHYQLNREALGME